MNINRRRFLMGATGATLALPNLNLFAAPKSSAPPKRLACIGTFLGLRPDNLFPRDFGLNYTDSFLTKDLVKHKKQLTIFSNMGHPGMTGGHLAEHSFLSGIKASDASNYGDKNITMDQVAANFVGGNTRFASLGFSPQASAARSDLSWTRSGVAIPPIQKLQRAFDTIFKNPSALERKAIATQIQLDGSILDGVRREAARLSKQLGTDDREILDQYFTSIRSLELRIKQQKQWIYNDKPGTDYKLATYETKDYERTVPAFYDMMVLALQSDSTRVTSLRISDSLKIEGMTMAYHAISHTGNRPEKLDQLKIVESFLMKTLSQFLTSLKETNDIHGNNLFDTTTTLFGSGLADGGSHSNKRLPIIVAGGGFKHQGHVDCSTPQQAIYPACNLFLTLLNDFGVDVDKFGTSNGTYTFGA